ncbi:DNA replication and repair protein RecN [Robiginitalea myxolifaciens]|uniref:DNA repair protein RecN n=1 Tax=Robiginitalea myxolifaciens TaxID=400055 RepID=A0A1I6GSC1_9FLAO|nr:DNA repair protein RecN [Robiginitalea myxolifaciens]SFR45078.1 DNA replication and repair protein RecN [Robiginitalea myxolifaciens]
MLTHLAIKNYALIDDLQVNFASGFSTITGETGAGKSILLQSLGLVLGNRADRTALRDQQNKCIIEAEFGLEGYPEIRNFFEQEDLDYDTHTLLRREIRPNGKSRAFINDTPTTLDVLQQLGNRLIDIHSQHQTLELTGEAFQLRVVDALAGNGYLLRKYAENREEYKVKKALLEQRKAEREAAFREQDYNAFLLEELLQANLSPGMLESLEARESELSHAELILEMLGEGSQIMDQEEFGLLSLQSRLRQLSRKLAGLSPRFEPLAKRLESLYLEAEDISAELADLAEGQDSDPKQLQEVTDSLQLLYDLLKKHQAGTIEELLVIRDNLDKKVSDTAEMDGQIEALEEACELLGHTLEALAGELHTKRAAVLPEFVNKLKEELANLGMPHADFKWELTETEGFGPRGKDRFELLFTANQGGSYGPLKKTASGGELSRIMLTIKGILSAYENLPAMIFDEIDTGVSGEISARMGDIMQRMSGHMQVIAITHLPQVASKGDRQYKVFKEVSSGTTHTRMQLLSEEDRIRELASMLGGDSSSDAALTHARELLN